MQPKQHARSLLLELALVGIALIALIVVSIAGGLNAPALWTLVTIVGAGYLLGRGAARGRWPGLESRQGSTTDPVRAGDTGSNGEAMTVSEERLSVDKRQRARERLRVRKYVVTEQVTVTVPVRREHVRIEREPIPEGEAAADAAELGAPVPDYEITLLEETVVVDKRVVPRERLTVRKHVVTDQEQISEVVRHEEVEVERDDVLEGTSSSIPREETT
jgi:uncharacterized protein (TIGR02271 family)